ncbi:cbb3-type cytochrome oxidase assembly protein CcoS [Sphingomonas sp. PL-96]|uniref:cbb3-type cytochrome oxidase assembly protein CcoS n=1 Tax=Sphingomonas sp. PL-96 TaxID=2887201 RepID=UPI001E32B7C1|nr:cbb3-type cytochrome oxidase assembly protein CcoS [Sphingomonas sp. PL-96]MCC2975873.1 cbb3-type cytochrome oxidase assembly protein CcoS [Sphingomonas sp. PL-96]
MNGLAVLIPIALLLGLAGLGAFFWSVKSGQFEDMDGAAMRVLIDDEAPVTPAEEAPDLGKSPKG